MFYVPADSAEVKIDLLHKKHVQGLQRVHTTYVKINIKITDIRKPYSNLCDAGSVEQFCGSWSGYRSGPAFQVNLDPYSVPDPVPDADPGFL
jgi:hypothetical protein